jgi:tRNA dimethylallyltransferase
MVSGPESDQPMVNSKIDAYGRSPKMVVIVGPTGVGKTSLALQLANQFDGEIISADSRSIYRGMDIGTDKPSLVIRNNIHHHLIDICYPDQTISLGQYKKLALDAINQTLNQHSHPFLVGGTGQYIMALVEGWQIPEVAPDENLRKELGKLSEFELERWLKTVDPVSAGRIDRRNKRRVIRALEVAFKIGKPFSSFQKKEEPDLDIVMIGLTTNREAIYKRADERVDNMMASGLLEEVIGLRNQGYSRRLPAMSGLGYKQLMAYLDGECSLEEAIIRIKFETHRFIRQQSSWFRADDQRIKWFDICDSNFPQSITDMLENWFMVKS